MHINKLQLPVALLHPHTAVGAGILCLRTWLESILPFHLCTHRINGPAVKSQHVMGLSVIVNDNSLMTGAFTNNNSYNNAQDDI